MKELIEFIAKKLVEHPEDVVVRLIEAEDGHHYELRVHPEDMGRIIGKDGRTAKAIRALLGTAATKADVLAVLDIVE